MSVKATDFRISIGYVNHPKIRLLKAELGADAVLCHLALIDYCATNKPNGLLHGMSIKLIEAASGWQGEKGAFVAALSSYDINLLDHDNDGYSMHDWEDHQPWVAGSEDRSEKARKAGKASGEARSKRNGNEGEFGGDPTDGELNELDVQSSSTGGSTQSERPVDDLATPSEPLSSPLLSVSSPSLTDTSPSPSEERKAESLADSANTARGKPFAPKHRPSEFREFYAAYPRADDPGDAVRAWDSMRPDDGDIEAMARCLARFGGKRLGRELASRCKSPGAWLRARRWESTDPFPGLTIAGKSTRSPMAVNGSGWNDGLIERSEIIEGQINSFRESLAREALA